MKTKTSKKHEASAKVVDGALVLSLPTAISPVVWRMDLGKIDSAALEVKEQKDGTFMLVQKSMKGEEQNIAPFENKDDAVAVLMQTSKALETTSASSSGPAPTGSGEKGKWLVGIVAAILLVILIGFLMNATPDPAYFPTDGQISPPQANGESGTVNMNRQEETGVPLSAEDFLMNR